jgi:multiple sugar transport system ATP-binding protein
MPLRRFVRILGPNCTGEGWSGNTVRENMGFALRLAKVDRVEIGRKVDQAAELLELTELLDRKPANLSGGQRQRVAMGRAIVRSPRRS